MSMVLVLPLKFMVSSYQDLKSSSRPSEKRAAVDAYEPDKGFKKIKRRNGGL